MIIFKKEEADSTIFNTIIIAVLCYIAFKNVVSAILVLIISYLVYSRTRNNGIYIDQKTILIKEGLFRLSERTFETNNLVKVKTFSNPRYGRGLVFAFLVDEKKMEYSLFTTNSAEISVLEEYLHENGIRYEET